MKSPKLEFTSKTYKAQLLITTIIITLAIIGLFVADGSSQQDIIGAVLIFGIVWKIGVRWAIWWNHD